VWYSAELGRMTRRAGGDEYPYVFEGNNPVNMTLPRVSAEQASMAQAAGRLEVKWQRMIKALEAGEWELARLHLNHIGDLMRTLGIPEKEVIRARAPFYTAIDTALHNLKNAEKVAQRYDGWYTYIPIAGTYVNMLRASYYGDDGMFAMYSGFFAFETLTLGAGAIESKPAQILAQQGVKAMVRAAGREAAQILATKVTRDLMLRVGASVGRQALWGAAKEGGLGAVIGGAAGWYNGQGFWQGALNGAYEGILSGAVTGAAGWFFNPTCFAVTMSTNATTGTSTLTTYKGFSGSFGGATGAATTTWNVDPKSGRMKSKVYADNSSISYYYRSDGKLDHTLYGGVTTTYGYTSDGRQNSVTYTQSGQTTIRYATEAYDQWGNATVISETLTPHGAGSSGSSTILESFGYDPINHALTSRTYNYASVGNIRFGLNIAYSHSGADVNKMTGIDLIRTSATDAGYSATLVSADYTYDPAGRLASVTGDATTTFGYDEGTGAQSRITTELTGDDLVTSRHYNASNGHLESIITMRGATVIYQEDLTYPSAGSAHYDQVSRKQVTSLGTSGTLTAHYYVTYSYDALNQLTGTTTYNGVYGSTESHFTMASETFAYDALGNRTNLNAAGTANIDIMNQPIADANSHTLTWDTRGNLTGTWEYAYTYDSMNRMTSAIPADHGKYKAIFTYDSANRRTSETLYAWDSGTGNWSTTPTSVTNYVYQGQMLIAEFDGTNGKMTKAYEWDPTKPNGVGGLLCITTYDSSGSLTGKYKPVYDANANITSLVDLSNGNVVANYAYTAFGICTATGPKAGVCLFRFGGMYWQASAMAYYNKARDVKAELGRFMQRDPSGEQNSTNLTVYCHNDPINRIDPTGLADVPRDRTVIYRDEKGGHWTVTSQAVLNLWLEAKSLGYTGNPNSDAYNWMIRNGHMRRPTPTSETERIIDSGRLPTYPLEFVVLEPGSAEYIPVIGSLWSAAYEASKNNPRMALFMLAMAGVDIATFGGSTPERVAIRAAVKDAAARAALEEAEAIIAREGKALAQEAKAARAASLRLQYLGSTPGKMSRTGLEVQARMQAEGNLIRIGDRTMIKYYDAGSGRYAWTDIANTDMAHRIDAVSWWNAEGVKFGPQSQEVRNFMLNPNNYELQPYWINRSKGAQLTERYQEWK
jgi:RHS repeat-associated protein